MNISINIGHPIAAKAVFTLNLATS
jgi:hypothetical protein